MKDLYEILGVNKNSSESDIKKAYRQLAKIKHPDKGGDAEEFKQINTAYSILSNPDKRKIYDVRGMSGFEESGGEDVDPFEIFNSFFGGGMSSSNFGEEGIFHQSFFGGSRKNTSKRVDDLISELELSLEDVYRGKKKRIPITRCVIDPEHVSTCPSCNGEGMNVKMVRMGPMVQQFATKCETCEGRGLNVSSKGIKTVSEEIILNIPKGIPEGEKLIVEGKTHEEPGKVAGDLIFIIKYKSHSHFKTFNDSLDILYIQEINLYEALSGFDVILPFLDNTKLLISSSNSIFNGISNDSTKILKTIVGKGFQYNGYAGNLHIQFIIRYPNHINELKTSLSEIINQKRKLQVPENDKINYMCVELCNFQQSHFNPTKQQEQRQHQKQECRQM